MVVPKVIPHKEMEERSAPFPPSQYLLVHSAGWSQQETKS